MLFSDRPRSRYDRAPVREVICQFRFPAILTIDSSEPADLQEAVRGEFPRYASRQEAPAPQIRGLGSPNPKLEQLPAVTNYSFVSEDNLWKINLTRNFIALSTLRYNGWEDFAHRLDRPLAEFIRIYHPAFFERIGLRYVNLFSRAALGLEDCSWAELLTPAYVGLLAEEDVNESNVNTCAVDFSLKLDSSCQAKVHAGPGRVKPSTPDAKPDPEQKFVLDMDLSMGSNIPVTLSAGALETLHGHATRLFEGALTEDLRAALRAESV